MKEETSSKSMLRGTAVVSSLTLLSRILGFVREILVARIFGAGLFADALFVAFRIPNLLRAVFAEGALTAAFVPVFSTELLKGREAAREAMRSIAGLLLIATGAVSCVGIFYAPEVVSTIAPGFLPGTERYALCVTLTRILMPYIMFVSIIALLNGALNSVKIFGASAIAQVIMNLSLIVGALLAAFFEKREATYVLAWTALVGGILQVFAQIPAMRRANFSLLPSSKILTGPVKEVIRLMLPAVLGAAVYQVSIFLSTQFASMLEVGSVAWLSYADRLTQLPIGVFTIALSSVLLPTLSNAQASGDKEQFRSSLIDALRYSSFVMIPMAVFIFIFAEPLIFLLFERGHFDHYATIRTAQAVQGFSVGLWAVSCHSMLVRAFNAQHDTRTPTLVGFMTLVVQVFLSLIFMGTPISNGSGSSIIAFFESIQHFLGSIIPSANLGHAGLALSSSLTFFCSFITLGIILNQRVNSIPWQDFRRSSLHAMIASCITAIILVFVKSLGLSQYLFLLLGIPCALIFYFLVLFLLKNRESKESLETASRLWRRCR